MDRESREMTARTVGEAIEIALLELVAGRDEVEVEVVSKGRAGILGIGAEPAKVRVTRIAEGQSAAGAGLNTVNRILKGLGVYAQPTIVASGSGPDDPPVVDIQGEDAGLLIGRRGETLNALQFIVNLLLTRQGERDDRIVVDVEQYRERRRRNLTTLAQRTAERVTSSGRAITLEPMSAADRRIIHMALADHARVATESDGEGRDRKVTVRPVSSAGGES